MPLTGDAVPIKAKGTIAANSYSFLRGFVCQELGIARLSDVQVAQDLHERRPVTLST